MVKKVFPFLPARLGLRGRAGRGLKNVCVRRFEVTDRQRDFQKHLIKIKGSWSLRLASPSLLLKGNLEFRSVKRPKRAYRRILWLWNRRAVKLSRFVICSPYFKDSEFTTVKGISKRGMWKGYHLSIEGVRNSVRFLSEIVYKRVCLRLELKPEPPLIKHLNIPRIVVSQLIV